MAMICGTSDQSRRRSELFGSGLFRIPEYGIEYKDIDSCALANPGFAGLAFELCRFAATISLLYSGKRPCSPECNKDLMAIKRIIDGIINNVSDKEVEYALSTRSKRVLLSVWNKIRNFLIKENLVYYRNPYGQSGTQTKPYEMINQGAAIDYLCTTFGDPVIIDDWSEAWEEKVYHTIHSFGFATFFKSYVKKTKLFSKIKQQWGDNE
jgi:hypothetical protein